MKTTILFTVLLILCYAGNTQNVGVGTSTPRARLHVADSSVLFTAPANLPVNAGNTPVVGPGHRMMWFANKAAFRLGRTTGNQSDAAQIGQLSFAAGQDNMVSGFASAAFGTENKLSSGYNFAAGYGNETRSVTAAAFGFNNLVKAQHGFAIGLHNDTSDNANPNVAGTMDRLFQIGNGSSGNNRRNAITVLRNGNTGIGTVNPLARLQVADSAVLFNYSLTVLPVNPSPPPLQGAGVRMMWYPQKAAFRAGGVDDGTSIGLPGVYPLEENNWNKDSIGTYSFASGYNTKSKGIAATAMGYRTTAKGDYSTAMGFYSTADGLYSTSFGLNTVASGTPSIAMGNLSIASGPSSTAMGYQSIASGPYATAMGEQTQARAIASTSMGVYTQAKSYGAVTIGMYNDSSDAPNPLVAAPSDRIFQIGNGSTGNNRTNALTVLRNGNTGIGTVNPLARLHVADSSVVFTAPPAQFFDTNTRPPVEGTGRRLLWFASRSAFRAGFANSTEWNRDSIGFYSFATGSGTKAIGSNAAAFGDRTEARGLGSFATGEFSQARGQSAVAMGFVNTAIGLASLAIGGSENRSIGDYSTAMGYRNTASGQHAQAFGNGTIASGTTATTFGYQTQATNNDALAIGQSTIASGVGSFAAGNISEAKGTSSMALGYNAIAQGSYSTALGYSTRANGSYATAIGFSSVADGTNALATGQNTSATGAYSSSFGWQTNAKALGAMTVGVYNDNNDNPNTSTEQSTDRLFQIGNGNSTIRSNAITVLRNGYTGVGVTDPAFNLDLSTRMRIRGAPGFTAGVWLNNEGNTAIPAFIGMYTDNLVGFYGSGIGWGFVMNTTTGNANLSGSLTQNSDARLKKDIEPLSNTLETLEQINGYTYNWKDASNSEEQIGLLAQEIQKVYPQLVKENEQGTLSVNYSGMVPVLLEAIKEQQKQIAELKKLVTLLQGKIK